MSKLNHIHQADLEDLNAYLDGALSEKEKAIFQLKLAKSLPLQATLREYTFLRNACVACRLEKRQSFHPHHRRSPSAHPRFTFAPLFSLHRWFRDVSGHSSPANDFQNVSAPCQTGRCSGDERVC